MLFLATVRAMHDYGCGHSHDNNKSAVLGLLITNLILAVGEAGLFTFAAAKGALNAVSVLMALLFWLKSIGTCVGLAGASQRKPGLLLGYFITDVLWVSVFATINLVVTVAAYPSNTPISFKIFPPALELVLSFTPLLSGASLALAFQTRSSLVKLGNETPAPCGHTEDNNRKALQILLSVTCVLTIFVAITRWFFPTPIGLLLVFVPALFNLVVLILGMVAVFAPLSATLQSNLLLAYFVLELIYAVGVLVIFVGVFLAARDMATPLMSLVLGIFMKASWQVMFWISGASLVLAWQSRTNLQHTIQYYPLTEDSVLN